MELTRHVEFVGAKTVFMSRMSYPTTSSHAQSSRSAVQRDGARITSWLLATAGAYPLIWLACFYGLVLRTRFAVGHWPYYAHPDPKDTGFDLHYSLLMWGMFALPFIALVATAFGLFSKLRSREVSWWLVVAPFLAAFGTIVYLKVEPGDFIGWFLD